MDSEELQALKDEIGWKAFEQMTPEYFAQKFMQILDHLIMVERKSEGKPPILRTGVQRYETTMSSLSRSW